VGEDVEAGGEGIEERGRGRGGRWGRGWGGNRGCGWITNRVACDWVPVTSDSICTQRLDSRIDSFQHVQVAHTEQGASCLHVCVLIFIFEGLYGLTVFIVPTVSKKMLRRLCPAFVRCHKLFPTLCC